jgi:uncharacterized integral membrane protein
MRKAVLALGILIFLDIFYFAFVNMGSNLSINYLPFIGQFQIDAGLVYLWLGLYGALGSFLLNYYRIMGLNSKLKKQARNTEKSDIVVQDSTDKVKSLQAKIDSLEVALKEALSKK